MGILNGINTDAWNPASDNFLKVQYSANDMQGKAENKAAMRRDLVLSSADDQWPVVGCITRLVPQKGVHLIKHAIYRTLEMGNQFELLGSCPVPHIQISWSVFQIIQMSNSLGLIYRIVLRTSQEGDM
ncbi:hypothetical protein ERO13_D10G144333v2 [Gossypium hirsutum]|uniref:starch synthase n=1 Tax=Gossypium hirsutum TaxID=3635 RepID=A0ABM3ATS6_GOSHI|nr:probable starch synthase 4, chloroplastic/amyloplastic isoform X2 [Gossypium hirsutum]KAG4126238.1 hypothetical protein ERO13_D10G144333v2 [Gossypium hirsutum]